jgi:hypothetical protein
MKTAIIRRNQKLSVNSQSKRNSGRGCGGYSEKIKMVVLSLGNFLVEKEERNAGLKIFKQQTSYHG